MNTYSDVNYHLMFTPECAEHTEKTQYFSEIPACSKPMEITTVCNRCGTVVSVETKKELEHRWNEWEITEPSSAWSFGERVRTCALCNETQSGRDMQYWWAIPLAIAELITLLVCAVMLFKGPKTCVIQILLLLVLSFAISAAILKTPIFSIRLWDSVTLGIVLSLNLLLEAGYIFLLFKEISGRYYYAYQTLPVILSVLFVIMLILGITVFSGHAITCVIIMSASYGTQFHCFTLRFNMLLFDYIIFPAISRIY